MNTEELDDMNPNWTSNVSSVDLEQSSEAITAFIVPLSGGQRGTMHRLMGDTVCISQDSDVGTLLTAPSMSISDCNSPFRLHRLSESHELEIAPGHRIWLNGESLSNSALLATGDVLEIGSNGVLLRYCLCSGNAPSNRSLVDAFSDCIDCARYSRGPLVRRSGLFLANMFSEVTARTTFWFRLGVVGVLILLALSTAGLTHHNLQLNERLVRDEALVSDLAALLERTERTALTREDFGTARAKLEDNHSASAQRIAALEARSGAPAQVIATASESIVFLQGAYSFVEEGGARSLRYVVGPDGNPLATPQGGPAVSLDGTGPVAEAPFTGTGFVVSSDGLIVTNRHVAVPWESDPRVESFKQMGLVPVVHRFLGYLPSLEESFDVGLVSASEQADVALLRGDAIPTHIRPLELSLVPPRPGDEVIVMGYPTGFHALLARADAKFREALRNEEELDFWSLAQHLATHRRITPLATRGIVGQITPDAVVYDAETAQGGSGGPVLGLNGKVLAINTAILREFGGSNLGVLVNHALPLLTRAGEQTTS